MGSRRLSVSGPIIPAHEARFTPSSDRCSPRLDGDISGVLHMVAALPTTPRDAIALTMARPVEMMGELLWSRLSPAEHAAMNAASRRAQDDPQPASAAGSSAGAPMDLACRMSDAEVDAVLNRILAMTPEAARAEYRAQFRADRETARRMACLYRDAT